MGDRGRNSGSEVAMRLDLMKYLLVYDLLDVPGLREKKSTSFFEASLNPMREWYIFPFSHLQRWNSVQCNLLNTASNIEYLRNHPKIRGVPGARENMDSQDEHIDADPE